MDKVYREAMSRCFEIPRKTRSGEVDNESLDGCGLLHKSSLSGFTVRCKRGKISGLSLLVTFIQQVPFHSPVFFTVCKVKCKGIRSRISRGLTQPSLIQSSL